VKYENLILSPEKEISNVLEFLSVEDVLDSVNTRYVDQIPQPQQPLHPLIDKPLEKSRITAWQKELPPQEIWLLQKLLRRQIKQMGYELVETGNLKICQHAKLLWNSVKLPLYIGTWLRGRWEAFIRRIWEMRNRERT
ncbi:MAG: hypothetical protein KGZ25_15335, partial [Planctomycetes bacterium]|nr:hypothetical protein [Planctomycetota bacterium]